MAELDAVDVIRTKRDGGELADEQVDWVVQAYADGRVADEQMAALAMAILLRGMGRREVGRWTAAMIRSGERLDLGALGRPTVDKHSTGGVGDKITLPLAPLVDVLARQAAGQGHAPPLPVPPTWIDRLQSFDPARVVFAHDHSVWMP